MPELIIHPLPETVAPEALWGGVVVVIDLLRATTTIVHALAHGARSVYPAESIDEAWKVASRWPKTERLLGGERHGVIIEGFDLDNSPLSYTPARVAGQTIVFTTTNGTRAMRWANQAAAIRIASFANLTAVADSLSHENRDVHLLCAGTDRRISGEDLLLAGAIADRLGNRFHQSIETLIFRDFWKNCGTDDASRLQVLRDSAGGRNLVELGFDHDIEEASRIDLFPIVPVLEMTSGMILPGSLGQ